MDSDLKQLHDRDFNLWIENIKIKIQKQDFDDMDWDNLLDEIDDMGASQKRALDSYMQRLIEHILKLKYWQSEVERCRNGWMVEVTNFRSSINRILKKNFSLKNYLNAEYQDLYQDASKAMALLFEMPKDNFVAVDKIMQDNYFG
ncbi:protein of unknown function DUF29 [Stanieria cyanosphaera PCC 7437]|uniref:DUF29 domain-containing protein n=1 Tax=Stanieria cyanosphaera (strain ATCC 29371 / PCC 7437) TaxID=111780 RepID=K9XYE9_STAC7|nr:DUF29 domain-containing protein [Stanieria cyanosphaera]AFZ36697.1 protein of unknown function DUF29 [Stanieria cyanosphaera PCC 7437]